MKKIILSIIMILSFITIGINCYATTDLIPLQESENYKGMQIIPKDNKNDSLLMNISLELVNGNQCNVELNCNVDEIYFIVVKPYLKTKENVNNLLTPVNDRNISYLINNYDYEIDNNNLIVNNAFNYFCSLKGTNLSNNQLKISDNRNCIFLNNELEEPYKYTLNIIIYIPKVENDTSCIFSFDVIENYVFKTLFNYNWIYQYNGIYSYYNCNSFSMPKVIINNHNGYNCELSSCGVLQGSGNLLDLQPTLSTYQMSSNTFYSMFQMNYLYAFLTNSDNKSFSSVSNGFVDLYAFGNTGQYTSILNSNIDIFQYDDLNSSLSTNYFDVNFNYFVYFYTFISNNYNGGSMTLNNLLINNDSTKQCYSYFKANNDYYQQDVGQTNNTDLASDLGITYINCDWWNLKGQLNNLIYYIITGLPFLNNLYSLCLNIFSIGKIGFNFFTWSIPLASLLCFIIAIRIVFDKMMK